MEASIKSVNKAGSFALLLAVAAVALLVVGSACVGTTDAQIVDGGLCSDIIARGGNPGNATVCRATFTGTDSCAASCARAGGTCFREGACCPDSWIICGAAGFTISACVDPVHVTCCGVFSSPGGTAPVLCDPVTPDRAFACSNPFQADCITTNPNNIPPPPQLICGPNSQPFDPTKYVCLEGAALCPKTAPLVCNGACFDPKKYACAHGRQPGVFGNFLQLCPIAAPDLCGSQCYSKSRYVCYSADIVGIQQDALCPVEAPLLCGRNTCFTDANAQCINGIVIPK